MPQKKIPRKKKLRTKTFAGQELQLLQQILGLLHIGELKPNLRDVVFVCIHREQYKSSKSKTIGIGIAVLDTRDLIGVEPGEDAADWLAKAQYAHYRPIQSVKARKERETGGCERGFSHGVTKWIDLEDFPNVLKRLFQDPSQLHQASYFGIGVADEERNIIVVGHGLKGDHDFLWPVGLSLASSKTIARFIDTATLVSLSTRKPIGLRSVLSSLDVVPVNLYNAGNSAAYGLQALVTMALRDYEDAGSVYRSLTHQSSNPRKLSAPVYNNLEAPYTFAGSLDEANMDEKTKAMVSKASKAAGTGINRKARRSLRKAKRSKITIPNSSSERVGSEAQPISSAPRAINQDSHATAISND